MSTTHANTEDFAALYDEIAALVRARVPLETGLTRLAEELPGSAGAISSIMSEHLHAGRSLETALEDPRLKTPPVFRAALLAGVRSGRLAEALEGMALASRRMSELRRAVGLSVIYPTIVLCIGLLEMPLLADVLGGMVQWLRDGHDDIPAWMLVFEDRSTIQLGWWIAIPCVIVLVTLLMGVLSGGGLIRGGWKTNAFRLLPWVRPAIDNARRAHFSDQLALLVEHGVPLAESLRIAAGATVDPGLKHDALAGAEAIARGQSLASICSQQGAFTPMLRWLMGGGAANQTLGRSLRHAAATYQRRAIASADLARIYLPSILTAIIGGGVVITMAILLFWPWTQVWQQIVD